MGHQARQEPSVSCPLTWSAYSQFMAEDEAGTIQTLKSHRDLDNRLTALKEPEAIGAAVLLAAIEGRQQ